tara:strand:+ start:5661 stop:6272 length:612 start_codon:yes stop_codon:yes gene_type:complete
VFSGIVETTSSILSVQPDQGLLRISIKKPSEFNDLSVGDSIACNGICLTVEDFNEDHMVFAMAAETLQVTGWTVSDLEAVTLNLERSLRFGDRVHGHIVTGHVDAMGTVVEFYERDGSWFLVVKYPDSLKPYIWSKGSVALNGVSLTINAVGENTLSVCLIPETIQRTNLKDLAVGHALTVEVDNMARGLVHQSNLATMENPS